MAQFENTPCFNTEVIFESGAVALNLDTYFAHCRVFHNLPKRGGDEGVVLGEQGNVEEGDPFWARDLDERYVFSRSSVAGCFGEPLEVEAEEWLVEEVSLADLLHGVFAGAVVDFYSFGGARGVGALVHGV